MTPEPNAALAWRGPLEGFLEAAPDAIVVVDLHGKIVSANRLTEELFGYGRQELIGRAVELLVPDRRRARHVAHRQGYTREPRTRSMGEGQDLAGRRKDGTEFPVEISLAPLDTEQGRLVISIIRDTTQRRQADASFKALLEAAPDGIVVVNSSGKIVIANPQTEKIFGYSHDELIGQTIELLVPERSREGHVDLRVGYATDPRTRPMGEGRELSGRRKDGAEVPIEISLSPLTTGKEALVISIIRDTTQRREAEERVKASLREKEVLLKEIHHRVKNNLQVTSSLLKLQSSYIQDGRARELFAESQGRIRSMALVHEKLYQSSDLSRIDFAEYIESLAGLLLRSFGAAARRIALNVHGDQVFLAIDTAVPCGLIVNELLSNCLKHAFPDNRAGVIDIHVRAEAGRRFSLSVRDDGVGLPAHIDIHKTETLGLQLVKTLAEQLRADIEVVRDGGTEVRLHFGEGKS
jgi:PAS domain S-box-containing protein